MEMNRKLLLIVYGIVVFVVGVLFVPYQEVWGPEQELHVQNAVFAPLWKLVDSSHIINGFPIIYTLQVDRLLYTIFIITLLFYIAYTLLASKKNT